MGDYGRDEYFSNRSRWVGTCITARPDDASAGLPIVGKNEN